jgi:hypothetical protein
VKKAYHHTSWRYTDNWPGPALKPTKLFCGINFGYDFCAEHEIGISGIRDAFGIKTYAGNPAVNSIKKFIGILKPQFGIGARKITKNPLELQFKQKGDFCGIYYSSAKLFSDSVFEDGIRALSWEMSKPRGNDVVCYWGDNSFMLVTTNHSNYQELKKGFVHLNMSIFTVGEHGLVLCLPDVLDDKIKNDMHASDTNAWELRSKMEDSGIEKELKDAKKQYHAIHPEWKDPAKKEICFWLNPCDQKLYNYGRFTVAELREWINGKGPIMKDAKKEDLGKLDFKKNYYL